MRTILIATSMTLILLALPLALAGGGDREEGSEAREASRELRASQHASHAENRSALHASFQENLSALRQLWHNDTAAIREACHAVVKDENATKEQKKEAAHCVRDGYKAWRALHRDDFRALKQSFRELMRFGQ